MDYQGGKMFGQNKARQEQELDEINDQFRSCDTYKDVEDFEEKLLQYKAQFIRFDLDMSGDIDEMEMKQMLEKLEQPKTHREIKKMIAQVDTTNKGTVSYADFLVMMLGGKNSVLRMILLFEEKGKPKILPSGKPKKKSLADLGIRPDMAQHLG